MNKIYKNNNSNTNINKNKNGSQLYSRKSSVPIVQRIASSQN